MKTLLHVGLWMLLTIDLVVGIKCHNCLFMKPAGNCITNQIPCRLYIGHACYKRTVYFGKTLLFRFMGCTPKCIEVYEQHQDQNITQIVACCSNRNFCNA